MKRMRKNRLYGAAFGLLLLTACGSAGEQAAVSETKTVKEYAEMSYGEFKDRTGKEAEFYHGNLFLGEIPDSSVCAVYSGTYDEDAGEASLKDGDAPIRLQGPLGELLDGIEEGMTLEELVKGLSPDGSEEVVFELLEGGTAYYVGNTYVQVQFSSEKGGTCDRQLLISLDQSKGTAVGPETAAWIEAKSEAEESL